VNALQSGAENAPAGSWIVGLALLGLLSFAWLKFARVRP
jgi:hypothetical protein